MTADGMLRIGDFARASWLSIKALRTYHEIGLLIPAAVDAHTGYRSYSVSQLVDAAVIRRLRRLDVPLASIKSVLDARDPAVTRKILSEHARAVEERLAALQRAVDDLYLALEVPEAHTPVHRRHEAARTVLIATGTVTEDEFEPFLARSRHLLSEAAAASGGVIDGHFGGCYPPLLDEDAQDVVAFIPLRVATMLDPISRSTGVRIDLLPATDMAVLVHIGGYDKLEDSYRTLGGWVAANADAAELPVRELYVIGPPESDDPSEYRTEICWPVEPRL